MWREIRVPQSKKGPERQQTHTTRSKCPHIAWDCAIVSFLNLYSHLNKLGKSNIFVWVPEFWSPGWGSVKAALYLSISIHPLLSFGICSEYGLNLENSSHLLICGVFWCFLKCGMSVSHPSVRLSYRRGWSLYRPGKLRMSSPLNHDQDETQGLHCNNLRCRVLLPSPGSRIGWATYCR